jgi:hypothetical protein
MSTYQFTDHENNKVKFKFIYIEKSNGNSFINMEADLKVQYVNFPPPTSDFFGSKFFFFLGTKLGQFFFNLFF